MSLLRERKKDQTRRTLQRVALTLFASRGYDQVTVQEIAAQAEVSPRTVFRYFPRKDDLVLWDDKSDIVDAIDALPTGTQPLAAMRLLMGTLMPAQFAQDRELIESRFRVIAEHPDLWARLNDVHRSFAEELAPTFARLAGVAPNDFALRVFLQVTSSVFEVAMQEWMQNPAITELPEIVGRALDLLASGLPVGQHR